MNLDQYLSQPGVQSMAAMARALGLNADQLRQWRHAHDGRRPSPQKSAAIERETLGAVTCEELRPDLEWTRLPDPDWPHPGGRPVLDVAKAPA